MKLSPANVLPMKVISMSYKAFNITVRLQHQTLQNKSRLSDRIFSPFSLQIIIESTFQTWSFEVPLINTLYLSHSWEKHTLNFPEMFWKIQRGVYWSEKELIISECFCSALFRGSSSWTVKWWCQRSVSVFCRAVHPPCNGFFCKGEVPFTNCIMHLKCLDDAIF